MNEGRKRVINTQHSTKIMFVAVCGFFILISTSVRLPHLKVPLSLTDKPSNSLYFPEIGAFRPQREWAQFLNPFLFREALTSQRDLIEFSQGGEIWQPKTPAWGKGSCIAREASEDVVPVDREAAYNEEVGEEPVIGMPKKTRKNKDSFTEINLRLK